MKNDQINLVLIEDDKVLAELIATYLRQNGVYVEVFNSIELAIKQRPSVPIDLIICDIMLPGMSGFQGLQLLTHSYACPLLYLTARTDNDEQLKGLELGACDYITKPISPELLLAKIKANLRKFNPTVTDQITIGKLTLKQANHEIIYDEIVYCLTTKEFELLWVFVTNSGKTLSREYLFEICLGRFYNGIDRSIDLKVSRLRKRLQTYAKQSIDIVTVHGEGYRLSLSEQ